MSKHGLIKATFTWFLLLILFTVSLLSASSRNNVAHAASHSSCGAWSVVASSNPGSMGNILRSIAALSASNVWAVGSQISNNAPQTLIEQWNGKIWKAIASPNVSSSNSELFGVTTISPSNAWAVGLYSPNGSKTYQTLIEQWNGTTWSVVPSPNLGTNSSLASVVALSSTNVWAVGNYSLSGPTKTLIEHWNGSSWSVISSPNKGTNSSQLYAITAVSANNLLAVGSFQKRGFPGTSQTLIEQWNGSAWSIVKSPNVKALSNSLSGVTATSAHDIWAVGAPFNPSGNTAQTLIEHSNGSQWSIVKSPNVTSYNFLQGVTAVSSRLVWAVGYSFSNLGSVQTLIEQWNGSTWSIVSSPNPSSTLNILYSVAHGLHSNKVWAVGTSGGNPGKTLTEFYC